MNNKLYFSANDSVHGTELWITDGTTLGTVLFDDIFAGPGNSSPYDLTLFNNKMYFNANDSVHGAELWVTDGTLGGTAMVADIYPGSGGSSPANMTLFNNEIYFEASNASHAQIWKTDGTTAGTVQVTNIFTSNGFGFYAPVVNDNQLFFQGTDSITIWQFFSMNTSDSLTLLAPGIAPNPNPLDLCSSEVAYGNSIIYCASYNSIGDELWIYTPAFTAIGQVNEMSGISAYPNPFTNNISLNGLKNGELYQLTLTDIQGRTVNAYEVNGTGSAQTLQMPETLANGVYMLQISSHGAVENVRLVKQ